MVDALVLSGGASHGDFEVGAVRRLFEVGFQPALIVAVSVGSVNAVTLCQMGALATAGSPSELEQIWLGLTANTSMYTKNPDFDTSAFSQPDLIQQLQNIGLNLDADYTWRLLNSAAAGVAAGATAGSVLGPLGAAGGAAAGLAVGLLSSIFQSGSDLQALMEAAQPLIQGLQNLQKAQSQYTLDPISKALFTNIDPTTVKNSPIRLLMAVVSLESGDLRYITGSGAVMQEDTTTPYSETYTVNQLCQNDLDNYNSAVADLDQVEGNRGDYTTTAAWQKAVIAAQAAVATAKAALDACERDHGRTVTQPVSTDVRTGVLASASIPMIFTPVKIGNQNYVDGGTRNQVPITGAIAAGATTIWAVDCNHPDMGKALDPFSGQPIANFDTASFLQIGDRASGAIMPYQVELDNDAAADTRSATVTLVQPEMKDIHNGFTIDPGLIRIRMAHGYMRTDDVMFAQLVYGDTTPVSVNAISGALHTTDIVSLRYQIWCREQDVVGWQVIQDPDLTVNPPTAPAIPSVDQQALADVRQMKKQLQQKVAARVNGTKYDGSPITLNGKQLNTLFGAASPGGRIPEEPIPANTWWLQYEAHQPGIYPGSVFPPIPPRQDDFSAVAPPLWDSNTPFTPLPLTSASKQVACLDSAQHVHQLFVTIGIPWAQKDLTVLTGAPPAVARSPLSGYQWPGGNSEQVVYLDGSGHVHELWVTPSTQWKHADLTQLTGAPPVVAGSPLSGYAWDYQWAGGTSKQVDYLDAVGHVHEMWVVAGGGPWKDADLTAYAGAPPAVAGSPLSGYAWDYQAQGGTSKQVVYLDGAGHVHELWVTPSTPWQHADLTQLTGAPPAVAGSPLSGYAWDYQWAGGTSKQVDYLDTAGHVHEMWVVAGGGPWKDADLTAYAGAPPAVARSPLSGYQWAARLSA